MKFTGLNSAEAKARLDKDGPNMLQASKKANPAVILFSQFKDFLTLILLVSTVLSFLMGDTTEAIAIIAIVTINALLGFFQEYRTEKTIEALKNMAAPHSRVVRGGQVCGIPSTEIVRGDVVLIESGDKVPADARLLESFGLQVDESLLTGESVAVEKMVGGPKELGDIYMGTIVSKGRATAEVTKTGMDTRMGQIAGMLDEIEEGQTPLQKRLSQLGKFIAIGCLLICGIVAVTGIIRGEDIFDMFMLGISLSVAAVPEGLAAIVTISLALAVNRMVKRNALIRRLHAVETLGCSTVICSDKTGTLTENRMTVKHISTYAHDVQVGDKDAAFTNAGKPVNPAGLKDVALCIRAACLCNNASLDSEGGDPTETALLVMGKKANMLQQLDREYKRLDELPFDSDRKCMSVLAEAGGKRYSFCKGAPDVILTKCNRILTDQGIVTLTDALRQRMLKRNNDMALKALRVIGVAYKEDGGMSKAGMETGLVFAGLVGMIDPPRKESYTAVRICKQAGIRPVMITGDHVTTAKVIAQALNIYTPGDRVLTGSELDSMSNRELIAAVQHTTVFARVSPRHKLQIVRAFKHLGHVVAMTGDGVNDAPAIKEADIGVSMGVTGTDVAKEAAEVILLDDNFATMVAAIEEGRIIYKNIRKFIRYLLSCNVGEVMTMFLGMLFGMPVILLPIQILWINLVTDGLPAIALGLDPSDSDVMRQQPRKPDESVFSHGLMFTIIVRGMVIAACTIFIFTMLYKGPEYLDIARTGAFMTLVITQLIHVFECKSETKSIFKIKLTNNPWLLGAVFVSLAMILAAIYLPPLQNIFHTVALPYYSVVMILLVSLTGPVVNAVLLKTNVKKPNKVSMGEFYRSAR